MRAGRLSPLAASEPRTSGSESSSSPSLPTPSARDFKGPNPNARQGGDDLPTAVLKLLPTPEAKSSTAGPDYARSERVGSGGDDLVTTLAKLERGMLDWAEYRPAIERWEGLTRPAPEPIEENTVGKPRLAAQFSEWMMGWDEGWVTDLIDTTRRRPAEGYISRTEALRMVGNGVCTQQAAQALRDLLDNH
ncbi:DNA methylase [Mycobacterium phage Refuge]|uniref:DNA methylase n=1 Tax=Mycobacterium phage Refuge TaxID=2517967 RepID=A0A482JFS6_9CAUD|nr:DNA methyltransferase [Mycobacterium phage Refuge]QBP31099.1 DNA methylase [Mycobacterium phage Refuge]